MKLWLDKLKSISYEMDNVLNEWNTAMIRAMIEKAEKEEERLKLALVRRGRYGPSSPTSNSQFLIIFSIMILLLR